MKINRAFPFPMPNKCTKFDVYIFMRRFEFSHQTEKVDVHTYICTEAMLYLPSNKLREGIINLFYVFKRNNKKNCPKFYNMIWHFFACMAFVYVYEKFKYIFSFCQWPLLGMFGLKKTQNRTFMAEVVFSYCLCPPCI